MRLSTIGQMAFLLVHSPLVHSRLGPTICTPAPGSTVTPAFVKQVIVGLAPLMYARVDPIVSPNKASAHVHLGMGGSNWNASMEADTALDSSCTSTQAKADNSVYWTPRLSFRSPQNGSYISVPATQEKVYYSSSMPTSDKIVAFPPGFQMLIGDPYKRSQPDATPLEGGGIYLGRDSGQGIPQPVQFTCPTADGSNPYAKQNPYGNSGLGFPMANCDASGTGLRYDVYFADCWDGKSLTQDLTAPTSGRNYSSTAGTKNGEQNCPAGWTHFPAMHMEVYWDIDSFKTSGVWNPASDAWPFELAQGDPLGFGLHGDYFAGWGKDTLQTLIDECYTCDGDNEVDACLDPSVINTPDEMNACNVPSPVDEPIWGWLENQPGCNKRQSGPQEAVQATCEEAGLSAPTTQHTDVPGWTYQGCYLDYVNFEHLLTGTSASLPNPVTPEWCAGFCSGTGTADNAQKAQTTKYQWMSLEYSSQCFCGNDPQLLKTPSNIAANGLEQGMCNSVCTADQTQICGGSNGQASFYSIDGADTSSSKKEKRVSHLHRHAHAHAHDSSF